MTYVKNIKKISWFIIGTAFGFIIIMLFTFSLFRTANARVANMYQSTLDSTRIQTNRCDSVCHLMLVANDKVVGMAADSVAFREAEASLKEQTIRMQYRFTQILADLRLEFSNQLGSLNGWLSLWIAFLATIGALLPIFMSFIVREEYKKELNSLKAEKEQEKALLLNNRLMSVANAIETLIYDDCTPP